VIETARARSVTTLLRMAPFCSKLALVAIAVGTPGRVEKQHQKLKFVAAEGPEHGSRESWRGAHLPAFQSNYLTTHEAIVGGSFPLSTDSRLLFCRGICYNLRHMATEGF
jgi:hypothetical protein